VASGGRADLSLIPRPRPGSAAPRSRSFAGGDGRALPRGLRTFRDERGRELLDLPVAPRPDPDTPSPPRFLPEFDNLILSHADRTRIIAEDHRRIIASKNGMVPATVLIDGFVRGTWKAERTRRTSALVIELFEPLPKKGPDTLVEEGERLIQFIGEGAEAFEVRLVDKS
jgi:hypothetical protein